MTNQSAAGTPAPQETAVVKPAWETFELKRLPQLRPDFSLFNFQAYAVYKSLLQKTFCIALSTGLGKTLSSYASFFYYRLKFPNTRAIVVTNKSAVLQFRSELDKFFDHDLQAAAVYSGMPRRGAKDYRGARHNSYSLFGSTNPVNKLDVLVMNYATFRIDIKLILKAVQDCQKAGIHVFFITDEATVFKNISTATHRAVNSIAKLAQRNVALTATLTKGKLEEIYGIYKALGYQLAPNKEAFEDRFCIVFQHPQQRHIKQIQGYKNVPEFVELIKPVSIVLRKIDVAKFLPAYTLRKIYVEHSESQFQLISDIYSGLIDLSSISADEDAIEGEFTAAPDAPAGIGEVSPEASPFAVAPINPFAAPEPTSDNPRDNTMSIQALSETGFIKRALLDPRIVHKKNLQDFKEMSPKTEEIIRMLCDEFTGEKIVIYTQSKMYLKLLKLTIEQHKDIPQTYKKVLEICGDVKDVDREENKRLFTETNDHNLIIINDAGLESINLQAGSVLIVTTMPSSGGNLVQLAGRLSRIGSKHSNLYMLFLLTENSQDEDEYLIIHQQMQLMASVMGEAEKGLLDWDALRAAEAERMRDEDMTQEDLERLSMQKLLLHKRKKRSMSYGAAARQSMFTENVEEAQGA